MSMDPYHVIKRPHASERSFEYIEKHNTYVFRVDRKATKDDIRNALKQIWNVDAASVRTMNVHHKLRKFGRIPGHTTPWKKALVRLPAEQAIEALR